MVRPHVRGGFRPRSKRPPLGGQPRDLLLGGTGPDWFDGQQGFDRCRGGPGEDHQMACEDVTGVPPTAYVRAQRRYLDEAGQTAGFVPEG